MLEATNPMCSRRRSDCDDQLIIATLFDEVNGLLRHLGLMEDDSRDVNVPFDTVGTDCFNFEKTFTHYQIDSLSADIVTAQSGYYFS